MSPSCSSSSDQWLGGRRRHAPASATTRHLPLAGLAVLVATSLLGGCGGSDSNTANRSETTVTPGIDEDDLNLTPPTTTAQAAADLIEGIAAATTGSGTASFTLAFLLHTENDGGPVGQAEGVVDFAVGRLYRLDRERERLTGGKAGRLQPTKEAWLDGDRVIVRQFDDGRPGEVSTDEARVGDLLAIVVEDEWSPSLLAALRSRLDSTVLGNAGRMRTDDGMVTRWLGQHGTDDPTLVELWVDSQNRLMRFETRDFETRQPPGIRQFVLTLTRFGEPVTSPFPGFQP